MAKALKDSIEKLRKKSRTLLARVGEDSKRVNTEVTKLHSQTLSTLNHHDHGNRDNCVGRKADLWKLRNDSSGVDAVLRPDFSYASPKRAPTTDMIPTGKVTLTSKRPQERNSTIAPRKPVKECYCYSEVNRALKLLRSQCKPGPYRQCKSQLELGSRAIDDDDNDDKAVLTSPISCETFRRVRKIDYTPRSQFLRNVQSKIDELQAVGGQGDCSRICPRSSSYRRLASSARLKCLTPDGKATKLSNEETRVDVKQESFPRAPANTMASERSDSVDRDNVAYTSSGKARAFSRKRSKSTLRKTVSSRRQMPESMEDPPTKSPIRSKRATHLCKRDCRRCCCCCCYKSESDKTAREFARDKPGEERRSPEYRERRDRRLRYDDDDRAADSSTADPEVEDLRRFREQNYFETHGSGHTLTSSSLSGSLQQYLLNERLFPEPVRRIHKQNLVVTMPPCATTQKKRIHYFPRHVVRQEKNVCNTNYRRKRCQSCPLTGHAIDLGILRARPPLNSLALKYQKRVS